MNTKRVAVILAVGTAVALAVTPSWTDAEEHVATRPDRKPVILAWYTAIILGGVLAALTWEE